MGQSGREREREHEREKRAGERDADERGGESRRETAGER